MYLARKDVNILVHLSVKNFCLSIAIIIHARVKTCVIINSGQTSGSYRCKDVY